MQRRTFLHLMGKTAAVAAMNHYLSPVWAGNPSSRPIVTPNIILIVADDLGYGDISCQGGSVPTPNIDSIASNGVRFTSGYVIAPVCTPSRAGFMTGRYQQRFGFHNLPGIPEWASPDFIFPATEKMIPQHLSASGYQTGIFGKWHLGYDPTSHPLERGFKQFYGILSGARSYLPGDKSERGKLYRDRELTKEPAYLTEAIGEESVSFIKNHAEHPFFLYTSFTAVHTPLQATEKYLARFAAIDNEKQRIYAAILSALDDAVGAILAAVQANGLAEKTMIVFISDNGGFTLRDTPANNLPLKGSKASLYEGGIRVPFMIRWDGTIPAGVTNDTPVISLDLLPTILTAALPAFGSTATSILDGQNLMPLLSGDQQSLPERDFYWLYEEQWAIRSGDWKLVCADKATEPSLYNLADDIAETTDLSAQQPQRVRELREKFETWAKPLPPPKYKYNERKPAGAKEGTE